MARKRHSDEDILKLLREIEVKLAAGSDVQSACRGVGISEATYYNWRKRFGGMGRSQLSEMRSLEKENARLEEDRRGTRTGQADPEGKPELPKAQGLTTEKLRQAVIHTRQKLATSERRTCRVPFTPCSRPENNQASSENNTARQNSSGSFSRSNFFNSASEKLLTSTKLAAPLLSNLTLAIRPKASNFWFMLPQLL